jgi:hypothetical protein
VSSTPGEMVPNPSGVLPYKVVFKKDDGLVSEWPVSTSAEGEAQIALALRSIGKDVG